MAGRGFMRNCSAENCDVGIVMTGGEMDIEGMTFTNCKRDMYAENAVVRMRNTKSSK